MKNNYRCLRCGATWRSCVRWWCKECGVGGSDTIMNDDALVGVKKGDETMSNNLESKLVNAAIGMYMEKDNATEIDG